MGVVVLAAESLVLVAAGSLELAAGAAGVAAGAVAVVALENGDDGLSADALAAQAGLAPTARMITVTARSSLTGAPSVPNIVAFLSTFVGPCPGEI